MEPGVVLQTAGRWTIAPVETERLVLTCVEPADAGATGVLMSQKISQWLANWPMPFTTTMAAARIVVFRRGADAGACVALAIRRRPLPGTDDTLIGWISLSRDPQDYRLGSLSFWMGEAFQGFGFMQEAARRVIALGFETFGLARIEGGAQSANAGSLAVMRACAMRPVGDRMEFAPARNRAELCVFYEIRRPDDDQWNRRPTA